MSNLGFQWVYRLFNREEDVACDRFFVEDDGDTGGSGDVCARCSNPREYHDEESGECPDRKGDFQEGA